ncbi:HAD-IIB family hydrolase [Lactiplantibacillus fabifermentans]|nr:HAD-IIB family hydrolase [Lactiplantibacillus fabifermentans]ETY74482.1 haloacid dehalogenase [Lactiplantibacillus fabifermentans T30PCM01]
MIQHIFSDLDGTLLNAKGQLASTTRTAIQQLTVPLTLVSARAPFEMQPLIDQLHLTGPQIAFNGGLIFEYHHDQLMTLQDHPIAKYVAASLLTMLQHDFPAVSLSCYTANHWYTAKYDHGTRYEEQLTGQRAQLLAYDRLLRRPATQLYKIMVMTRDEALMNSLVDRLWAMYLPNMTATMPGRYYLEITSDRATKANGIQFIQQQHQLATDDILAIGNAENDLSMLQLAGQTVVMTNVETNIDPGNHRAVPNTREQNISAVLQPYTNKKCLTSRG